MDTSALIFCHFLNPIHSLAISLNTVSVSHRLPLKFHLPPVTAFNYNYAHVINLIHYFWHI